MSEENALLPNSDASNPCQNPDKSISRRTSCSSEHSSPVSCQSPSYDSGHFSGSNTSDLSIRPAPYTSEDDAPIQQVVQRLQSEVERLIKSERWYKNELRIQKRSRVQLLEKLYGNEQKFIRENQKLQLEYRRLCDKSERRSAQEKDDLVKQFRQQKESSDAAKGAVNGVPTQSPDVDGLQFELQRQKSIVEDNENVIRTLKAQRQNLLNELHAMAVDRDTKFMDLEKKVVALEYENRAISLRCLAMDTDTKALKDSARIKDEIIEIVEQVKVESQEQLNEIDRLAVIITALNHSKESEIQSLKNKSDTASDKLEQLSIELEQLMSSYMEKKLQNEQLQAEIEEYRKMRENFNKYVTLLQGNSAQLDSKCKAIESLQSEVVIQTAKISELNKCNEATTIHWQSVIASLQDEIDCKDNQLSVKRQLLIDLETRKSQEIKTLRNRLEQLERLNEKLIGQLNRNSADMSTNLSQIVELKNVISDLNELSVENAQLREQLDVRESNEAFIAQLQAEIRSLKNSSEEESNKVDSLKTENGGLEAGLEKMELSEHREHPRPDKNLLLNELKEIERYESQMFRLESSPPLSDRSRTELHEDVFEIRTPVRNPSRRVPETCDIGCQATAPNSNEVEDLRLLYKVLESEYRKQLSRYELHICTLLGKIKSYRINYTKEKDREQKILKLQQQLDMALKRGSDVDLYKKMNLQLKTRLAALIDDSRKIHLNCVSSKPIRYKELYKLIDESDQFVPNCNRLSESIADLKNDFLRLRTITRVSNFHQPMRGLSLMDELKAAGNSFNF